MLTVRQYTALAACLCIIFILSGCTPEGYRKSADDEAYSIIKQKSDGIEGMPEMFTIEIESATSALPLAATAEVTSVTRLISLQEALEIAVNHSREYQSQKESLYSQALSLSMSRHDFNPHYSGNTAGDYLAEDGGSLQSIAGALQLGITKMLATGGDISTNITTNLSKIISGGDAREAFSTFVAELSQPLLRGAGRRIALENLTQAERDMVYAIRDFVRYRKTFSVGIAQSYYSLLQQKDEVFNLETNYQGLKDARERAEWMAEAGRMKQLEVDQQRQQELSARDQWNSAIQSYQDDLDQFKISLGLPMSILIEPDPAELEKLTAQVDEPLDVPPDQAIRIAIDRRLDLRNDEDKLEDAERRVMVAADNLKPGLDVLVSYQSSSGDDGQPFSFRSGDTSYSAGLNLELPLDRKSERNQYRQALISRESTGRNLTLSLDQVNLDVRQSIRALEQAKKSYDIQLISLKLAEQRVDSTSLLQLAGRANTRDVLESREDLLSARNAVTLALVKHYIARLYLLVAMESLKIDSQGFWKMDIDDSVNDPMEGGQSNG